MAAEDVVNFELLGDYRMKIWFGDGKSGEVDISEVVRFEGYYFEPLKDIEFFRQVTINHEVGVLHWPNDAEIDPLILYSKATGKPIRLRVWREEEVDV